MVRIVLAPSRRHGARVYHLINIIKNVHKTVFLLRVRNDKKKAGRTTRYSGQIDCFMTGRDGAKHNGAAVHVQALLVPPATDTLGRVTISTQP